jgi:hypothetical protein
MSPPAQLFAACRAGVNKEVEHFLRWGSAPKPGPVGLPPTAPAPTGAVRNGRPKPGPERLIR